MVNKFRQNVLSASRIVGICSNLARRWSVELFAKRSTVPFTTFPELSTATKPLKELRRLIMAKLRKTGQLILFRLSCCSLTLTNFVFRRSKAAKLGKQLRDYFVFGDNLSGEYLSRTMIEIVKPRRKIIFAPFGIITLPTLSGTRYYSFVIPENNKRRNWKKEGKLFCIYSFA